MFRENILIACLSKIGVYFCIVRLSAFPVKWKKNNPDLIIHFELIKSFF